jgi:hypothetical protein
MEMPMQHRIWLRAAAVVTQATLWLLLGTLIWGVMH